MQQTSAVPRRTLGRTGEEVSIVGLGGFHLGKPEDPEIAVEMVRRAIDAGITFMDNCWDYHEGESERRMGRALAGGYRDRAFVMTKLDSRSREGTLRQFEESLERLQTDRVDLLQLHEVIRDEDPDAAVAPGGALDAYLELKEQGACRYIGFTGHKDPGIHRKMIERAAERGVTFDTVQMPINVFDSVFRSFSREIVPLCRRSGIGVIGMKPLSSGRLVGAAGLSAPELLRWALGQDVDVLVTGCESIDDVEQAVEVASAFEPLAEEESHLMTERVRRLAETGRDEQYKTGTTHDGTSRSPQWLE